MTTHKEFMDSMPKNRRKAIEDRAPEILAEEMTLQELRKARWSALSEHPKPIHKWKVTQ